MKYRIALIILIIFSVPVSAQEIKETNTDSIYFKALDSYKKSNYKTSLQLTNRGLELAPAYHDIRILRIRNYWAFKNYDKAGVDLIYLFNNAPEYPGVTQMANRHLSLIKEPVKALEFVEIIEQYKNQGPELKVLKASLLLKARAKKEARDIALDLFSNKNLTSDQRYTLQNILRRTISNELGVNYQYIDFSEDYSKNDPWQTISGEYLHYFGRSAIIGRLSQVDRGYDKALLYEVESYPVFSDRVYAFINLGVSNGDIFPELRTSASVFVNVLKSFELEAGGRLLHFSDQDYFTGIAGITYYTGRFYLNTRAFIGPYRLNKMVQNYQFNIRYYFKDIDNYLFARAGSGISPDERSIFTQVQENPGLDVYYMNFGINKSLGPKHIVQLSGGLLHEDLSNGNSGRQLVGNIGYRFRF